MHTIVCYTFFKGALNGLIIYLSKFLSWLLSISFTSLLQADQFLAGFGWLWWVTRLCSPRPHHPLPVSLPLSAYCECLGTGWRIQCRGERVRAGRGPDRGVAGQELRLWGRTQWPCPDGCSWHTSACNDLLMGPLGTVMNPMLGSINQCRGLILAVLGSAMMVSVNIKEHH